MKKATTTMKTRKSGSNEGKGGDSPSQLIDARIKELSDWRGGTIARSSSSTETKIGVNRIGVCVHSTRTRSVCKTGQATGILDDFRFFLFSSPLPAPRVVSFVGIGENIDTPPVTRSHSIGDFSPRFEPWLGSSVRLDPDVSHVGRGP